MQIFNDNQGESWKVDITFNEVEAIKAAHGVDILNFNTFQDMVMEFGLVLKMLSTICEDEIRQRGLTKKQFFTRISGDTIDAANKAFLEALADFFPSRIGKPLRLALQKAEKEINKAAAQMEAEAAI